MEAGWWDQYLSGKKIRRVSDPIKDPHRPDYIFRIEFEDDTALLIGEGGLTLVDASAPELPDPASDLTQSLPGSRSIRELGGEIWAEMERTFSDEHVDWQARTALVDLVMAVLARHVGSVLFNDADIPVNPLPRQNEATGGGR